MIIVTGANGFVGSAILKYLTVYGYNACGIVRTTSDTKRLRNTNVNIRYADVSNLNSLVAAMQGCKTVVHCAARSLDWGRKKDFWKVNVSGVQNIIKAARRIESAKRIVYISTANVVGYGELDMVETSNHFLKPKFKYSRTKLEGEQEANDLCKRYNKELIILRPSAVYGPEDWKFSYEIIHRISHSYWPLVNGGKAVFTPVYIKNLCRAIELAVNTSHTGGIYNITDNITISWRELCEKIASILDVPLRCRSYPFFCAIAVASIIEISNWILKPQQGPGLTRYRVIRAARHFHYSCDNAQKHLGYAPDSNIDAHLRETVKWYDGIAQNSIA